MSTVREDTEGVGEEAQVSEAEGEVARRPKTERPLVVKPKTRRRPRCASPLWLNRKPGATLCGITLIW